MHKTNFRSLKLIEKKKKRKKIRSVIFIIISIVVLCVAIYLLNKTQIQIETVVVSGDKFINKQQVEQIAKDELSKKYLFILKKSNYFFFPKLVIENKIKENFVAVKDVKISRNSFKEIQIEITENFPVAVSCANALKTDCYLINEQGVIFANGPLVIEENAVELKNLFPELKIGQKYVDQAIFEKLIVFVTLLRENDFHPDLITTDDNETFKVHISEGPELYYEKHDDPKEVLVNLLTVMEKDSINKNQYTNIEYIDLRFGNKVYYKIK